MARMPAVVPTPRDVRRATNESVHRSANERLEQTPTVKCECECYRAECGSRFPITLIDYEAVRAIGHRFLVIPGHESSEETVVTVTAEYLVVDKVGDQASISDELDPR